MSHRLSPLLFLLVALAHGGSPRAAEFRMQEIETNLGVGYAVSLVDVDGDGRRDIVVVDTDRVLWYQNPDWAPRTIITGATDRDNVCIAPHDVDGDGRLDFALGAGWRGLDSNRPGTIQWLRREDASDDSWLVRPIGQEPSVHRMQWGDLDGDGRPELIVAPLVGRGTTRPEFAERGVRLLAFTIPDDPARDRWPIEVLSEELHVSHNIHPTDLDGDGRLDLLVASFEGVSLLRRDAQGAWTSTRVGAGNQESAPSRGASEITRGRLAGDADYLATIEPWHGFQVVVYTPPDGDRIGGDVLWTRHVLDEQLRWGHAVSCANLDDDPDQELIVGVRDDQNETWRAGVRIYDPRPDADAPGGLAWERRLIDPGGVAVEDLAAADLDGDGRVDLVAVGRQTRNVRIYWNESR